MQTQSQSWKGCRRSFLLKYLPPKVRNSHTKTPRFTFSKWKNNNVPGTQNVSQQIAISYTYKIILQTQFTLSLFPNSAQKNLLSSKISLDLSWVMLVFSLFSTLCSALLFVQNKLVAKLGFNCCLCLVLFYLINNFRYLHFYFDEGIVFIPHFEHFKTKIRRVILSFWFVLIAFYIMVAVIE